MKEKRYYIAYGSNLSVEQMRFRTPDAKIVGTAVLKDWRLLFKTHATIEPCEGKETPVLVWEISKQDEANLDRYEGYPSYYYKKDLELEVLLIGEVVSVTLTAMVYIMTEGIQLSAPYPCYYRTLEEGYRRFNFPLEILEQALVDSIDKDGDENYEICD